MYWDHFWLSYELYSQSNEEIAVGKIEIAIKTMDRIRPCGEGFKTKTRMDSWSIPSLSLNQWNMFTCSTMSCRYIKNTLVISEKWVKRNPNRPTNESTNNYGLEIKIARLTRSTTILFSSILTRNDGLLSSIGARFNKLVQLHHGTNK